MNTIDFIKEIETNYDVKSIKVKGIEIWPFLRNKYFSFKENENLNIQNKKNKKPLLILKLVINFFYGLTNLFKKKNDYLIFTDTMELRLKDGLYINKLFSDLYDILGKDKVLSIENPYYHDHFDISNLYMNNIVSLDFFNLLSSIYPFYTKYEIENEEILKEINLNYKININYKKIINKFFSYYKIFNITFKKLQPKIIFISEYYSLPHQAAVYTARSLGIKTVEFQHGIINTEHAAYNVFSSMDKIFFPEYLLVFGEYCKNIFNKNNFFIDENKVLPIGNMYINYINNYYTPSKETTELFLKYRKKYNKIVAISSQLGIEDKLIDFLKKSALISNKILYIFVPRNYDKDYSYYNFPPNMIIISNLDVYKIIKETDFHATVNSTCAIEAPALGVPNILININNLSKNYYSLILKNPEVTNYVNNEVDFVNLIQSWTPRSKKEIKMLHSEFYATNYKESLKKVLELINKDNSG